MQKPPVGTVAQEKVDIESKFNMTVGVVDGLEDVGDIKGVTTEEFADAESNVYIHKNEDGTVNRKSTDVTIKCYFIGDGRYSSWSNFVTYLSGTPVTFMDENRNVKAELYAINSTKPKDTLSSKILEADVKFKNMKGNFELIVNQ